jgi:hypothetical protein
MGGEVFLHRKCVPLEDVDLRTDEDRGQLTFSFSSHKKVPKTGIIRPPVNNSWRDCWRDPSASDTPEGPWRGTRPGRLLEGP